MAKLLVKKQKKQYVKELGKQVVISRERFYFVEDESKDFHCTEGVISKKDLKKKPGTRIKTNKEKEFILLEPSFIDLYKRIKRIPQIVPRKDIGFLIAETGINKQSKVVDAGSGSGGVCLFLANLVKEFISYEIDKEYIKVVKDNIKFLGLKNLKIKNKNIYQGIDETEVDLIVLDVPEPWNAIRSAEKALKIGGFLVSYSPSVPQVMDFVNTISKSDSFIVLKTVEIIERNWEVSERKVRPVSRGIGHSGFMTFVRKI
ncbi:methyltransferase domain-containing protein [Candidatus Woesearchaeota archaeon]|nr:methyltransferase domain-containing protein [Candidatus Woesearchaeota archaeon]